MREDRLTCGAPWEDIRRGEWIKLLPSSKGYPRNESFRRSQHFDRSNIPRISPKSAPYRLKFGEGVACEGCCDGLLRCTGVTGARPGGSGFGRCLVLVLLARGIKGGTSGGVDGAAVLISDLLSLSSNCSCSWSFDASFSVKESFASPALMSGIETSWSSHDGENDITAVAFPVLSDGAAAGAGGGEGMASSAIVGEE